MYLCCINYHLLTFLLLMLVCMSVFLMQCSCQPKFHVRDNKVLTYLLTLTNASSSLYNWSEIPTSCPIVVSPIVRYTYSFTFSFSPDKLCFKAWTRTIKSCHRNVLRYITIGHEFCGRSWSGVCHILLIDIVWHVFTDGLFHFELTLH